MKKLISFLILFVAAAFGFSQKVYQDQTVRMSLWAETDAYPGLFETDTGDTSISEDDERYILPVARIKKIAPFILEGMLYGWSFEYTPYDKTRAVQEYFEFNPVQKLTEWEEKSIRYKKPWVKDTRLYAWVEYDRTEAQKYQFQVWDSVTNPKIRGYGYAKLSEGFDGIQRACGEAMKNAVREHWRQLVKNKPKEIDGKLLLCEPPVIGIESGRYVVTLDFFIETDKIIEYKTF